jgi:hypothetical protein
LVLGLLLLSVPAAVAVAEEDPASDGEYEAVEIVSIEDALNAPAADLIQGYMFTKWVVDGLIPMAEMGMTVYAGYDTITERNAQRKLVQYKTRLDIYSDAINRRGYAQVAGRYRGTSTESCDRSGAFWLGSIGSDEVRDISISQEGIELTMTLSVLHENKSFDFDIGGYIVESDLILMDPLNSDYYVLGKVHGKQIDLRPDPGVLEGWPGWAGPPKRKDVRNCLVELVPY